MSSDGEDLPAEPRQLPLYMLTKQTTYDATDGEDCPRITILKVSLNFYFSAFCSVIH